jgi:lipopolysaccharide cholinephosphotransferase
MTALETYKEQHLRSVQLKELSILCAIRDVCENNHIDYWLDGGTILGAVRHGGFIPWDDDIDIAMRKEDIPRFVEAAKRELPDNLFMQTMDTDPSCRLPITKVRDNNSFFVENGDDFNRPYHKGLYVDIFPLMPYPSVSKAFCKRVVRGYCRANGILLQQHTYSWRSVAELFWFGAKRLFYSLQWSLACCIFSKDKFFSNTLETNGYGIIHRVEDIFPTSTIKFEGEIFRAPANPDAYLRNIYGDYMQLPPEEKRKGHAIFYVPEL